MATLFNTDANVTYKQLLQVGSGGTGITGSIQPVQDGIGTSSALSISTAQVNCSSITFNGTTINVLSGALTIVPNTTFSGTATIVGALTSASLATGTLSATALTATTLAANSLTAGNIQLSSNTITVTSGSLTITPSVTFNGTTITFTGSIATPLTIGNFRFSSSNTLITTNTNGNMNFMPNGTGIPTFKNSTIPATYVDSCPFLIGELNAKGINRNILTFSGGANSGTQNGWYWFDTVYNNFNWALVVYGGDGAGTVTQSTNAFVIYHEMDRNGGTSNQHYPQLILTDTNKTIIGTATNVADETITYTTVNSMGTHGFYGDIRIYDGGHPPHYTGFTSTGSLGSNTLWSLPTADGSANQFMITDGSAHLGWKTILRGTTSTYAGGGTSASFTIAGLSTSHIVTANILTSTNSVSITKAVPTASTLTITFSADPGAGTTINYIALT